MAKKVIPKHVLCNGEVLKKLRVAKGWTQQELGERSGFSVRTIQKAEAGLSIEMSTIEFLACALGTTQQPVTPETLIVSNVTLCKAFYKCLSSQFGLTESLEQLQTRIGNHVEIFIADCRRTTDLRQKYEGFRGAVEFFEVVRSRVGFSSPCCQVVCDEKQEVAFIFIESMTKLGATSGEASMGALRFTFKAIDLQKIEFVFDCGLLMD
ncbi:MAG: helix-turn-helix transcriptional regulator [Planctomycetota bacterium]